MNGAPRSRPMRLVDRLAVAVLMLVPAAGVAVMSWRVVSG